MDDDNDELMVIQTVIMPNKEMVDRIFKRGWSTTESGNPFIITPETTRFTDPSMMFPQSTWPLRTTLIQCRDFKWEVIEHCVAYYTDLNYSEEIEECNSVKSFVLTILHKKDEPLTMFGTMGDEEVVQAGGSLLEADNFVFAPEPGVPAEMQEGLKFRGMLDVDSLATWRSDALNVGSTMVGKNSSMALLRAAADFLGISKGGSKFTLWNRLNQAVQQLENQQLFQDANRLYREQEQHPGLQLQPTQEECLLHEHTHIPFRSWCEWCVSCKSKMTMQEKLNRFQKKGEKFHLFSWTMPMGRLLLVFLQ